MYDVIKKITRIIFYVAGVIFIAQLIHEIYHHLHCGGSFMSGFMWTPKEWFTGVTWCVGDAGGEVIPSIIEVLIWIWAVVVTLK